MMQWSTYKHCTGISYANLSPIFIQTFFHAYSDLFPDGDEEHYTHTSGTTEWLHWKLKHKEQSLLYSIIFIYCTLTTFNMQSLFTVKNPHLQLAKIDHVILCYLSLTSKTMWLWTLTFVSWFNYGQVFNKFKSLNIQIKMIFTELLLQWKLSFIRLYNQVI